MKNRRWYVLFGCAFAVLLLLFASCAEELEMTPKEIGTRIKVAYGALPACAVYDSTAEEGQDGYLPEERFALLLGAEKLLPYTVTEIYACMSGNPASCEEIMVFRCRTASDARDIAKLCLARARTLDNSEGSRLASYAVCKGKTVVYYRLADQAAAQKALARVIGG